MTKGVVRGIAMGLLFGWGTLASGEARLLMMDEPPRPRIVETVSAFWTKVADADAAGSKALFAGDQAQAEVLATYLEWIAAFERMHKALPGKPTEDELPRPLAIHKAFRQRTEDVSRKIIMLAGERASVSPGTFLDPGMRLAIRDGSWKVTHLTSHAGEVRGLLESLRAWIALARAVEGELTAGRAKSMEDVPPLFERYAKENVTLMLMPARPPDMSKPAMADAPKWKTPSAAELVSLPGTPLPSERYENLLHSMPGLPCTHGAKGHIEFFDDEAGISVMSMFNPPRAVESVRVFARGANGSVQYAGELPHGLSFADTRADVEKKLGRAPWSMGGVGLYTARYPTLGLGISYQRGDGRDGSNPIHSLQLTPPDPKADPPEKGAIPKGPRLAFRLVAAAGAAIAGADVETLPDPDNPNGPGLPVLREVSLNERDVARIYPTISAANHSVIGLEMTDDGAKRLERLTTNNTGRRLAMVFDGRVLIAPAIRGAIAKSVIIETADFDSREHFERTLGRMHVAVNSLSAAEAAQE
jgi:hypothetical protein